MAPRKGIDDELTHDRRTFLKKLAVASMAAPLTLGLAKAQMGHMGGGDTGMGMGHGAMASSPALGIGPDVLAPDEIPWENGTCAFCGMTIATPADGPNPLGFRERTYAQIRLAPEHEGGTPVSMHYESLACMFNHAYVLGIVDGHEATFYVVDLAEVDARGTHPLTAADLVLSRKAAFLWAADLAASMQAWLGAFRDEAALHDYTSHHQVGRRHVLDAELLADLAPVPEAGLLGLLNKHSE